MFWVIGKHIERREIRVELSTPVLRLIRTADNEVRGVVVAGPTGERRSPHVVR